MTSPSASGAFRLDHHISTAAELLRRNRIAEAKEELESALAIDAESLRARALYGLALFRGGSFEQALPIYEKLILAAPDDAAYHLNLGLVRLKLGDAAGAVVALERSRDLDPSQGRAVNYLGLAYARGGRYAEAYRAFLVAGQVDLAREIADNLPPSERAAIEASLRRPAATAVATPPKSEPPPTRPEHVAVASPTSAARMAPVSGRPALPPLPRPGSKTTPPPVAAPASAPSTPASAPSLPPVAPASVPSLPAVAPAAAAASSGPAPAAASTTADARATATDDDDELVLSIEAEPGTSGSLPAQGPAGRLADSRDDADFSPSVSTRFVVGDAGLAALAALEPMSEHEPEPLPGEPVPTPPAAPASAPATAAPSRSSLRAATARPPESSPALIIDSIGAISRAVADAAPTTAGAPTVRASTGARGPQPLSEFATARLVRPEDGDQPFELAAGGFLIVRVSDKMFSRTEGVDVTGGSLTYEPAMRRARGQSRGEPFAGGGRPMFQVTGKGHLIAAPLGGVFTAVSLDDDILYLREDLVFAFEPLLRWENGHVPGSRATIPMVQFRGTGAIAFRTVRPLLTVKLAADKVLYVDASALAGWIGRVVPRAVTAADAGGAAELFVECSGEGVVLVEEPAPLP